MSRRSFFDFLIVASERRTAEGCMAREALAQGRRFTAASFLKWATKRDLTEAQLDSVRSLALEHDLECRYGPLSGCEA